MEFDTRFEPEYGRPVELAPGILRVTAQNPGPFTFKGTNSYIVGTSTLAVIDPGPDDDAQLASLLAAIDGRPVSHILLTHTHKDHSPLAARLKEATGATTVGEGPHRAARPGSRGLEGALDAAGDLSFMPELRLAHGGRVEGDGWSLEAVYTPGHCANHLAFALDGAGILFSGDHVMAWSTTVVAPPEGAMADYMASLDLLLDRGDVDRTYLPGHGAPLADPPTFIRALKAHRRMRERAIVERVRAGDDTIPAIVAALYRDLDPRLHAAAGMSVFAHLLDLVERGMVASDGPASPQALYRIA